MHSLDPLRTGCDLLEIMPGIAMEFGAQRAESAYRLCGYMPGGYLCGW
jgi:hypothetical protein